ncbi:uncharacterized protein LOC144922782 [Branchiostoma floridae x Branchiostoma belcheri]
MYAPSDLDADLDYPQNAADLNQPDRPEPASLSLSSEDNVFNRPSAGRSMTNNETSVKTAYSDDDPYIQPYATYRGEEGDRDDSETNPTRQTEAHTPTSVGGDSNIQGTHNPPVKLCELVENLVERSKGLSVGTSWPISAFGTTYTTGYPVVDTTYTIAPPAVDTSYTTTQPVVNSTYTTGHPAVDTTHPTGHSAVDTTYTTPEPAVDTTYTTSHPVVDTTYTTSHPAVDTTYTTGQPAVDTTYTTGHPVVDTTYTTGHPVVDTTYTTGQPAYTTPFPHTEGVRLKSEKVTFISNGFDCTRSVCGIAFGVAVSADNEIYLPDPVYKQVKVFNMDGVFLRVFPTTVPGKSKSKMQMSPVDVTIDESGYLWVVGSETGWSTSKFVYVVKYSPKGRPLSSFNITSPSYRPTIAVSNNNILLSARPKLVHIFSPVGRLYRAFQSFDDRYMNYITSDNKGHIIVALWNGKIRVYNRYGRRLLQFSGGGLEKEEPHSLSAICTNSLDQIIVANKRKNRVDMFTSRGEFIRTVVNTPRPCGIAIGPEGQLVVTNDHNCTVTIFPRQTVFP